MDSRAAIAAIPEGHREDCLFGGWIQDIPGIASFGIAPGIADPLLINVTHAS
jgi:hypothetical protein